MRLKAEKIIEVDAEKCTGCRACEMACALRFFGVCGPGYSRIRIRAFSDVSAYVPVVCQACEDATCVQVCPMNARVRLGNGAVVTDEDRCIGCRACIFACPFSAAMVDPDTGKTMTCDFCKDDPHGPWCVRACAGEKALRYQNAGDTARTRSRRWARLWRDENPKARSERHE